MLASSCVIAASIQTPASALVTRGTSIYKIVPGPSWLGAEESAVKIGGHLVTINDAAENQFVSDFAESGLTPKSLNFAGYWGRYIGLTDAFSEGTFEWVSGEPLTYQNWYPNGEPNSYDPLDGNAPWADYVEIFPIDGLGLNGSYYNDRWNDAYGNGENSETGIAEIPFQAFNGYAYVRVQGSTLQDAIANALELSGTIVDNSDPTELAWLATAFSGEPTDRIARIPLSGSSASVPGPLPIFGAAAAFGFSRRLRRRIQLG